MCVSVVCLGLGCVWRAPMCVWCMCGGVCVVFVWSDFVVVFLCIVCVAWCRLVIVECGLV